MTALFRNRRIGLMKLLKSLGLDKDTICGIASMMRSDEDILTIVDRLEAMNFKTTPQETLKICAAVIKENRKQQQT